MFHRNSEVLRTKYQHDIFLVVMDSQTKKFDQNILRIIFLVTNVNLFIIIPSNKVKVGIIEKNTLIKLKY